MGKANQGAGASRPSQTHLCCHRSRTVHRASPARASSLRPKRECKMNEDAVVKQRASEPGACQGLSTASPLASPTGNEPKVSPFVRSDHSTLTGRTAARPDMPVDQGENSSVERIPTIVLSVAWRALISGDCACSPPPSSPCGSTWLTAWNEATKS